MLTLTMIAWPAQEPPASQVLTLPEEGGMIGRGEGCAVYLSDSRRLLSRHHGEIVQQDGHYFLRNWSRNGLTQNGRALAVGAAGQQPLSDGDMLVLGGYQLLVSLPPSMSVQPNVPQQGALQQASEKRPSVESLVKELPEAPPLLTEAVPSTRRAPPSSSSPFPDESTSFFSASAFSTHLAEQEDSMVLSDWNTPDSHWNGQALIGVEALADEVLREFSPDRLQHKLGPWRGRGWQRQSWWTLYRNYHEQLLRTGELHVRLREWFMRSGGLGGRS